MIEAFKTEIIEAEKSRTDLLKWKLVVVATLFAVGLGIGYGESATENTAIYSKFALTLVPIVASYVDLLCIHLQFRILVISKFFQQYSCNPDNEEISCFIEYEKLCEKVRSTFNLEDSAQIISTIILSILVSIAAFYIKNTEIIKIFNINLNINMLHISSLIGLLSSWYLYKLYQSKCKKLEEKLTEIKTDKTKYEGTSLIILHNEKLLDIVKSNYTQDSLKTLEKFLIKNEIFTFHPLPTHLFSAAELNKEAQYTGYKNVWIRDNIQVAHAHFVLGKYDIALNVVNALMKYFRKYKYQFEDIIHEPNRANNVMSRPHIRFDGETLTQVTEKWSHAQNDALGYFLWFYCLLVNNSLVIPDSEDCQVLALFPLYFQAIQYWKDADSGHWEEERKIEVSSIGTVKAGLDSLLQITTIFPNILKSLVYNKISVSPELIDDLAKQGESALLDILPYECNSPPPKERRYDAALLFLIYPLDVVSEEMSDKIVWDVTHQLQGDYGVRRYAGDSFWAPDYKAKLPPEKRTIDVSDDMSVRNILVRDGKEAQWCIFDSILSVIFGKKYERTGNNDYIHKQTWYLNRALGQLTGTDCVAGEFHCPELYYLEHDKYVPNDSTPLLWSQANLMLALNQMKISLSRC